MKMFFIAIFLFIFSNFLSQKVEYKSFTQYLIYREGKLVEKQFYNEGKLKTRVVFIWSKGILEKRIWYDSKDQVICVVFEL